ncbi:MAG: NUDIX domain-containing protein [Cellulomonadaceae bacterium]|nr:NUDIX domain-containing protein [Cellulomonadaceae bacterium]
MTHPQLVQRVAAYGIAREGGAVLLARASSASDFPGQWSPPGGGVDFGEHPRDCVVREFGEETGLDIVAHGDPHIASDVLDIPARDLRLHTVRFIYAVDVVGGALRNEDDGTTDLVAWVPVGELATIPLMPFARDLVQLTTD